MKPVLEWLRLWARRGEADRLALAYRLAFTGRRPVLTDLAVLCHAMAETYVPGDPHATAFNEGRRAVWLHIMRMLDLTTEDMRQLQEMMHDDRYGEPGHDDSNAGHGGGAILP